MSNNSRNTSSQSSERPSGGDSANKSGGGGVKTKYQIVQEGWGSRATFQHSHLLGMDPEGLEEGTRILEGYQEMDRQDAERAGRNTK